MTAKIAKVLIVVLVLATVLLAGNALVGGRVDTKATEAGTCCQAQEQAQTCPVACPKCCCPQCCGDEPCCLKTEDATGCSISQQKPCCASK
jgi:hypothetical protein